LQSTKLASVVTLLGLLLLLVIQPGIAQEEPPYMLYLPLIVQPTFTRVTLTQPANWGLYSRGADLAAATLATDIEVRSNDVTCFAWNSGNAPPYSPQYTLTRSFIAFDLSTAPEGTIVQAQLELYPWAATPPTTLEFWRGTWSGMPTAVDWNARGELLATLPLTRTPGVTTPITITLALEGQPVPEMLYLVLRGDESTPMAALQSCGVAFGLREIPEMPGMPISKLHLWIVP